MHESYDGHKNIKYKVQNKSRHRVIYINTCWRIQDSPENHFAFENAIALHLQSDRPNAVQQILAALKYLHERLHAKTKKLGSSSKTF